MKKVYIYTDGGSRGNPGPAGAGVFICDHEKNALKEVAKFLGVGTNNMAEYQAVVIALKTLKKMYGEKTHTMDFEVRMDSELIQRQLTGVYKVKDVGLKVHFEAIKKMVATDFPHMSFVHVRREQNKDADRLANEAMDNGAAKN